MNDGLIYYLEIKEDGEWQLMTLNPENSQISLFVNHIELDPYVNTMLLDEKNQK